MRYPSIRVRATWLEEEGQPPTFANLYFEALPRVGDQVLVPRRSGHLTVIMVTHDARETPATIHMALG